MPRLANLIDIIKDLLVAAELHVECKQETRIVRHPGPWSKKVEQHLGAKIEKKFTYWIQLRSDSMGAEHNYKDIIVDEVSTWYNARQLKRLLKDDP